MAEASLIQDATKLLADSRAAVAFTGAGLATPSGIPDFRSPETGLWARSEAAGTDETQAGTIQAFGRDPQTFYQRMKPLFQKIITAEPNAAHYALAELETRGIIHTIITQNADMLHQRFVRIGLKLKELGQLLVCPDAHPVHRGLLLVHVEQLHLLALQRPVTSEVKGEGGLSCATFLVRNRQDHLASSLSGVPA